MPGDTFEVLCIIGLVALAVCLAGGIGLVFWWFAGYICVTFDWYAIDQNCQMVTWLVFVMSGVGLGWRK